MASETEKLFTKQRSELWQRYKQNGLSSMSDCECLELLLRFTVRSSKDVHKLATELLKNFGSFTGVLEADIEELSRIDGISEYTATLLMLIPSVARALAIDRSNIGSNFSSIETVGRFCVDRCIGVTDEILSVILLDKNKSFIAFKTIQVGSMGAANMNIEKLAEYLFRYRSSLFILVHNHPSGPIEPSDADISTTLFVKKYFADLNKYMIEHIIVYKNRYLPILKFLEGKS